LLLSFIKTHPIKVIIPRRLRFDPESVHVGFLVDKVALGQVFLEYFGFPCQFHCTGAPLLGKMKTKLIIFLSSSSQGCTISLKAAVRL
jgi:hypothetical protein